MRIGVLTFHDGMNHGGFLQAYALVSRLRKWGYDAQIVHYRNRTHLRREYGGLLIRYNPFNIARNVGKIRVFKKAQQRMPLTRFTTSVEEVARMGFEAIVVGSDIVWNFSWPYLGGDRIYFGRGLETSRLVAYAPSFGTAAGSARLPEDILGGLRRFHALSVRDEPSLALLKKFLPEKESCTVLDPTFLWDWTGEANRCLLPDRFLLVYAFQLRPAEIDAAMVFARKNGLATVAVGYRQPWCDFQRAGAGPFEFLDAYERATSVLSSTFHGTLFALQFKKPFYTSCNEAIEPKTRDLLRELGEEDRLGNEGHLVAEALGAAPDYEGVGKAMAVLRERSMVYLRNALEL